MLTEDQKTAIDVLLDIAQTAVGAPENPDKRAEWLLSTDDGRFYSRLRATVLGDPLAFDDLFWVQPSGNA